MARVAASNRGASTRTGSILYNGSFEISPTFVAATTTGDRWIDGTATGTTATKGYGWATFSAGSTGTRSVQFDSSVSYDGTKSLKLSTLATASAVEAQNVKGNTSADYLRDAFIVLPNTVYNYSFYMKTNVVSGSSTGARLTISQRNSTGASVTSTNSTSIVTTQNWTLYTGSITTSGTTVLMAIRPSIVGNTGAGTLIMDAWYDSIMIVPATNGRVVSSGRAVA